MWVRILLMLLWCLLLSRAVHDEPLVGDRQFWVTRPFAWASLLAAKLLFLGVFVAVPLFLADVFILAQAHVLSLASAVCLLGNVAEFLVFGLPVLALATVTRDGIRMLLAVIGVVVAYLLLWLAMTQFLDNDRSYALSDAKDMGLIVLAIVPALVVVLLQYTRRRTTASVAVLVTSALVAAGIVLSGTHGQTMPPALARGERPIAIITANDTTDHMGSQETYNEGVPTDLVELRARIAPAVHGNLVILHGYTLHQTDAAGQIDNAPVTNTWDRFNDDHQDTVLAIPYRRGALVVPLGATRSITADFDLSEYAPDSTFVAPAAGSFRGPADSFCAQRLNDENVLVLVCNFPPLRGMNEHILEVSFVRRANRSEPSSKGSDMPVTDWTIFPSGGQALEPVTSWQVRPTRTTVPGLHDFDRTFCPGDPVTFQTFHLVRHRTVSATFPKVHVSPPGTQPAP